MAIRFGMTLAEIIGQLTRGFMKVMGRKPEALEKIKIQQEAVQRFKDMNKVVDMEGRVLDPSKTIMGGTQEGAALKSGIMKATGAKPKKIQRESLEDFVDDAGGVDPNDPRGIDDFIPDPDKMAQGGRAGFKDGMLKRGLKSITGTDAYKTLENKGFNAAVIMNEGFDQIYNLLSGIPGLAEGGRIGYKDGPDKPSRRKFMKMAAGIASLVPGLGMIGKGAKVAAPVVAKAAEITGPALAKIVETVMSAGKLLSVTGTRVKNMVTKKKLGKVEVEEDIADGSYIIKKDGKEIYYKPGRMDESGIEDDIIEVIEDRVKKAGGGIGYMLGE